MSATRDHLYSGSGNRHATMAAAEARQRTLRATAGICTGIRTHEDGTFSLVYDPWAGASGSAHDDDDEE